MENIKFIFTLKKTLKYGEAMHFYNPTNYAYLIGGIVSIIVSILILTKDIRLPLNILLATTLFFFGISLLFNALTYLFTTIDHVGVQIIRDVSTISGGIGSFLAFITAFTMYKGLHYLKKWLFIIPIIVLCIVDVTIGAIFDYVDTDKVLGGVKTTQPLWVMIFLYGIPVIMLIFSIINFYLTRREVEEQIIKKRILFFILGFFFLILGVLIYAVFGIIEQVFDYQSQTVEYITWIFASLSWCVGPILMLVGFYTGKFSKNSTEEIQVL